MGKTFLGQDKLYTATGATRFMEVAKPAAADGSFGADLHPVTVGIR